MRIGRHLRITGRVQGVFFRAWTREEAQGLGISGWVRNCSDGSVEALIEGQADALDELIELMREGPPGALVEEVDAEEANLEGLSSFEIRH